MVWQHVEFRQESTSADFAEGDTAGLTKTPES